MDNIPEKFRNNDGTLNTDALMRSYNELEKMRDYFLSLGYHFSVGVQIYSDVHGKMKLPPEERLSDEEYCHALYLEDGKRVFPLKNDPTHRLCEDFSTSIYITSTGDVIPCAKYREPIANIYKESLQSIWSNSVKLQTIQNYCWKDCDACNECDAKAFCVRCGAMAYIKGKDYLENCKETCLLAKIRASGYTSVPEGGLY